MNTDAILLHEPRRIGVESVALTPPSAGDVVVAVRHSGISTGTEKLFWSGAMPPFPGMGYPLVPGYEATGEVVESHDPTVPVGATVFVPGATCYRDAHGLFGASAATLVTPAARVTEMDAGHGPAGALLALAATAYHAMTGAGKSAPDLIVGHGTLGRLLARLTVLSGAPAPTVWDIDPARRGGAQGYDVLDPATDQRRDYNAIYDASGQASLLPDLIGRLAKAGEITLAGFYTDPIQFAFAPAFMREARIRIAAEWQASDMIATRDLVEGGFLNLSDLITHTRPARDAAEAYHTAFTDTACLKMILDWNAA
ncbi:2-desacetyl-2-hydroxyethyl bacteriochlorophyllide A dehydrogenase [Loktanella sp. 3ANDIMAR09]|uniref:chlorophyll synthesis pathway protein BchC n=1 Tax=Loktanella sp. 3ANDIMAR09 TaxID=1225657 RepID=UPI0006F3391E|nr:chlorophyll synthesis pathway protein BchC [Loktanella sp. 3ANDIMAR09]KQI69859.1 2-desacetyl-2-hydroxyethyl bacteriochlorophyllide A dehydrogenase [Loktanella sp. 3ANDIMAR09]